MSHVVSCQLEFTDLSALERHCKVVGLELVRDQTSFKWFGRFMDDSPIPAGFKPEDYGHCVHVIRIPGNPNAYEIGVVRMGKGYRLLWDNWQQGRGITPLAQQLIQNYATERVRVAAKGYKIAETKLADGSIKLTLTR